MSRLPIRVRLTAGFAVAMAVLLAATGVFVYLRFATELDASVDRGLRARAGELAGAAAGSGLPATPREDDFARVLEPGEGSGGLLTAAPLERARRAAVMVERVTPPGADEPVRVYARPLGGGRVLLVGTGIDDRDEALRTLLAVLALGGLVALALAAAAGYGLASAALGPVASMRSRAAAISRLGGGVRLPVPPARDELRDLGETLNEMLARLEAAAERERGFVATASHELRTPLALLRGELELALREGRSPAELRAAIVAAAEETDRLAQLADDLLVLARVDEGRLPVHRERLDAGELLAATVRRFAARAAELGRELVAEPAPGVAVEADRLRVEQALVNLVDNALRYGAGPVTVAAERAGELVRLHVRDRGPGFDPSLGEDAFGRFERADRGGGRAGAGLGLAIVAAVAEAHGGRAGAEGRAGGGSDVWIELPGALIDASSAPVRPDSEQATRGGTG